MILEGRRNASHSRILSITPVILSSLLNKTQFSDQKNGMRAFSKKNWALGHIYIYIGVSDYPDVSISLEV